MATLLKKSTNVTVRLGPFLDATDGVTPETGLTPTVQVSKNHAAFAARSSGTSAAHDANGWYAVPLNTTDTSDAGPLVLESTQSTVHLPVWREFIVVTANVYDSLVSGTDYLDVATAEVTTAVTSTVADVIFTRPTSAWETDAPAKSLGGAVMQGVHKTDINDSTGNLDVYKSDGTTLKYSRTVTTATGRDPIDSMSGAS